MIIEISLRSCCQTFRGVSLVMALIALIEVAGASILSRPLSRIPVALAVGGMRNLNNPCYNIIHTEAINTFV